MSARKRLGPGRHDRGGSSRSTGNRDPVLYAVLRAEEQQDSEDERNRRSDAVVYFLHVKSAKRIKVGTTTRQPVRRVQEITARHPELRQLDTELVGAIDGGRRMERVVHEMFAAHRVSGEWFSDEILAEVLALIEDDRVHFEEVG